VGNKWGGGGEGFRKKMEDIRGGKVALDGSVHRKRTERKKNKNRKRLTVDATAKARKGCKSTSFEEENVEREQSLV